jgi:hypothetical protein
VIELSFILISGSDRLQLKRDFFETRQLGCGLQTLQCECFAGLVISPSKTHRPAEDNTRRRGFELIHHSHSQSPQDNCD